MFGEFKTLPILILAAALALSLVVGTVQPAPGGTAPTASATVQTGHASIGAAIASNWMSAASFLGIAGIFFLQGYFAFAYILGWTGGYVLLLVLMGWSAPPLRQVSRPRTLSRRATILPWPGSARR